VLLSRRRVRVQPFRLDETGWVLEPLIWAGLGAGRAASPRSGVESSAPGSSNGNASRGDGGALVATGTIAGGIKGTAATAGFAGAGSGLPVAGAGAGGAVSVATGNVCARAARAGAGWRRIVRPVASRGASVTAREEAAAGLAVLGKMPLMPEGCRKTAPVPIATAASINPVRNERGAPRSTLPRRGDLACAVSIGG
jgi:hypothetical protein